MFRTLFCLSVMCGGGLLQAREPAAASLERPFEIVNLDGVFRAGMVLQRDTPLPIWGLTQPGIQVTVTFADQTFTADGDAKGSWAVELLPMPMSARGRDLVVTGGGHTITLQGLLVGDVWIASGGSTLAKGFRATDDFAAMGIDEETPLVRICNGRRLAREPSTGWLELTWARATRHQLSEQAFSRIAYFYARELQQRTGVPIGIYQAAAEDSSLSQWIRRSDFVGVPASGSNGLSWAVHRGSKKALPTRSIADIESARDMLLEGVTADLASLEKGDLSADEKMAARARIVSARVWQSEKEERERVKARGWKVTRPAPVRVPQNMYEAYVQPLRKMAIAGFIWCQGEADGDDGHAYAAFYPKMIAGWQNDFHKNGDPLPFIGSEVAPIHGSRLGMAYLREAQRETSFVDPRIGIAITTDLGPSAENKHDVHGVDHLGIATRLALWARAQVYGELGLDYYGPIFDRLRINGSRAIITFTHDRGGLVTADGATAVSALQMAGADKVFYPAVGMVHGDALIVTSEKVLEPVAVRCGFGEYAPCNLRNRAGLPVAAFRTDAWKGVRDGRPAIDSPVSAWQISVPYSEKGKTAADLMQERLPPESDPDQKVVWQDVKDVHDGVLDVTAVLGNDTGRVAFARSSFTVPSEQDARLWLGFDEGLELWLNDSRIYFELEQGTVLSGSISISVHLYEGENTLLLKLPHDQGRWFGYVGVSAVEDKRIDGFDVKVGN